MCILSFHKNRWITAFITVEVLLITILIGFLYRQSKTLYSINTIDKNTILTTASNSVRYFYEPKPNIKITIDYPWLPEKAYMTINKDSLNERFDYEVKKQVGTFRIITLGDSFTYGLNVSTNKNWTELLEDELNDKYRCKKVDKYEVINLGMEGYDTQYEIERYKRRGVKYNPDLIVWMNIETNRITEKIFEYMGEKKDKEVVGKDYLKYGKWERAVEKLTNMYTESELFSYQVNQYKRIDGLYDKNILYISNDSETLQKRLGSKNKWYVNRYITPEDKQYLLIDSHFNIKGNKKIALDLVKTLLKDGLIPCTTF